jgi:hypothetical protein
MAGNPMFAHMNKVHVVEKKTFTPRAEPRTPVEVTITDSRSDGGVAFGGVALPAPVTSPLTASARARLLGTAPKRGVTVPSPSKPAASP